MKIISMPQFYDAESGVAAPSLDLSGANELDNDDRVRVLAIIDQFRELGVNEDISLPQVSNLDRLLVEDLSIMLIGGCQLVVVGDQSSGKSSLLEGLTGISFPIASELCTRFATQIVLRRAPASEAAVSVSIIPGPTANADETTKKKLLEFGRTMEAKDFGIEQFGTILDEVRSPLNCCLELFLTTHRRLRSAWVFRQRRRQD